MAVMGEQPPEVWTDELHRTGRVVFPVRRRTVWWGLSFATLPWASLVISLPDHLAAGGEERAFVLLWPGMYAVFLGYSVWKLVTQRPVLTVDHHGIRFGRRKYMPWTEIGTIGIPHGPSFYQGLPIIPKDVWSKDLIIRQENIQNIRTFATWLTEQLAAHQTAEREAGGAPNAS